MTTTTPDWLRIAEKISRIHGLHTTITDPILCRRIYRLHRMVVDIDKSIEKKGITTPILQMRRRDIHTELTGILKCNKRRP